MNEHRMTGIGFYGKPHSSAKMLRKALRRYGMTVSTRIDDALPTGTAGNRYGQWRQNWLRPASDGAAEKWIPGRGQMAGFFLSMLAGKPQLHILIRCAGKGADQPAGR